MIQSKQFIEFKVVDVADFDKLQVPEYTYNIETETGIYTVRVVKGANYGIVVNNYFASAGLNGNNPYFNSTFDLYIETKDGAIYAGVPL